MAETGPETWRQTSQKTVGTVIAGVIVALVSTFVLPLFFRTQSELSYTLDDRPVAYPTLGNLVIEGTPTSHLFAYRVRLWNSGSSPLKNVPVLFTFNTDKSDFRIFEPTHTTKPSREFAKIEEDKEKSDAHSKRLVYALLNPGNEDVITFITNDSPPLTVDANPEGVKVKLVKPAEPTLYWQTAMQWLIFGLYFGTLFERFVLKSFRFRPLWGPVIAKQP